MVAVSDPPIPSELDPQAFTTAIGKVVSGHEVEAAAIAVLKKWSSTYIAYFERQTNREVGSLPRIRAYTTTPVFDKWPEDQLPAVVLISPGISAPPLPDGSGLYRASFALAVAVVVSTANLADTAELTKLYVAALRTCIIQHQSLEGFAQGVDWLDENYDNLPFEDNRSLGAGQANFGVEVGSLSRRWNGPTTPWDEEVTDTLPTDPVIQTADVTTQAQPIETEL